MTETNKYELTDITHPDTPSLRRIRALRDIPRAGVRAGDLGGWVERVENLDQDGDCWVSSGARVFGNAEVSGDAWVLGSAWVFGSAGVFGDATVSGNAWVFGDTGVFGRAKVFRNARVFGDARVRDDAEVFDDAWVFGEADVLGRAVVRGNARVSGDTRVSDAASVHSDAEVSGDAWVSGHASVGAGARVSSARDILCAVVIGAEPFEATLHKTMSGHRLHVGCWDGTVPEFRTMIESDKWVEATPEQIRAQRPEMLAFAAMCEARIATWEYR